MSMASLRAPDILPGRGPQIHSLTGVGERFANADGSDRQVELACRKPGERELNCRRLDARADWTDEAIVQRAGSLSAETRTLWPSFVDLSRKPASTGG